MAVSMFAYCPSTESNSNYHYLSVTFKVEITAIYLKKTSRKKVPKKTAISGHELSHVPSAAVEIVLIIDGIQKQSE